MCYCLRFTLVRSSLTSIEETSVRLLLCICLLLAENILNWNWPVEQPWQWQGRYIFVCVCVCQCVWSQLEETARSQRVNVFSCSVCPLSHCSQFFLVRPLFFPFFPSCLFSPPHPPPMSTPPHPHYHHHQHLPALNHRSHAFSSHLMSSSSSLPFSLSTQPQLKWRQIAGFTFLCWCFF